MRCRVSQKGHQTRMAFQDIMKLKFAPEMPAMPPRRKRIPLNQLKQGPVQCVFEIHTCSTAACTRVECKWLSGGRRIIENDLLRWYS